MVSTWTSIASRASDVRAVLGRTNKAYPRVWLRPAPTAPVHDAFVQAIEAFGAPVDVSVSPAYIGGLLRASRLPFLAIGPDLSGQTEFARTLAQVQAHVLETLCAIGRERLDFYFVRIREPLAREAQDAVMEAIEIFRQDGHIRFLGLFAEEAKSASAFWADRDAFEVVLARADAIPSLLGTAHSRRVGMIALDGDAPGTDIALRTVRSTEDVNALV